MSVSFALFEQPQRLWWLGAALAVCVLMLRSRRLWRQALLERPTAAAASRRSRVERTLRDSAVVGALVLLVVAAAGRGAGSTAASSPLLVALDVSTSMGARDVGDSRLGAALRLLAGVLPRLQGRSVGLLVFAGEARVLAPLTQDLGAIELLAAGAAPGALLPGGSDVAAAIEEALRSLPEGGSDLLLLTDGEATEGKTSDAATAARSAGMRIHAVGFGTPAGATIPLEDPPGAQKRDRQDRVVVTRLDEAALRALVTATGGSFLLWEGDSTVDRTVLALDRAAARPDRWNAQALLPALALFLLVADVGSTGIALRIPRRAARQAAVALMLLVVPTLAQGQTAWLDARRGAAAYGRGEFSEAVAEYEQATARRPGAFETWFGLGCAQLRSGRFADALVSLTTAAARARSAPDVALVQYNRGEALAHLNRLDEAAEAYRAVLRRVADDDARHNLAVVLERLRRRQPPSTSPTQDPASASAAPTAPREEPSADVAERLLREAERRQRLARRRLPGSDSPSAPEAEKDW